METIIAVSGYAQSGKDTTADVLVNHHGFTRIAFADSLRDCLMALNPIVDDGLRYKDIISDIGYESGKAQFPEMRRLLQAMGTEVGRELLGDDVWVEAAFRRMETSSADRWVITDCRFPNEANAVWRRDGQVWRVERPGVEQVNAHVSETALDDFTFDATLVNDGSIQDLTETVGSLVEMLIDGGTGYG